MKDIIMKITVICENCGNLTELNLKRNWDNALSLSESLEINELFYEKQSHPDETTITCLKCNNEVDFSL